MVVMVVAVDAGVHPALAFPRVRKFPAKPACPWLFTSIEMGALVYAGMMAMLNALSPV